MASKTSYQPDVVSPPGTTLFEKLEEIGMSQKEFAERTGKPEKTISAIINGESAITPDTSLQFERVLNIPARFWLQREYMFQEYLARYKAERELKAIIKWAKNFPVRAIEKSGWLPEANNKATSAKNLLSFFGVASPQQWERIYVTSKMSVAFRMSLAHTSNPFAISAWLRRGDHQAKEIAGKPYNKRKFSEILTAIKTRLVWKQPLDYKTRLISYCADVGVKVVFTTSVPKAAISGATRWVGDNPLIQLSGRYKTNDHFWFNFYHEAGHIILHGKKDVFLENVEGTEVDKVKEEEADKFAAKMLLHPKELNHILSQPLTEDLILECAENFKTHPAIIVGRLQHIGTIPYSSMNHLKIKIDIINDQ